MARLLLVDPECPRPYRERTLFDRPARVAETSAVRIAEGLAQAGHRVTVAQCHRVWPARSPGGVAYVPFAYDGCWRHLPAADAVVVMGQAKVLDRVRRHYPAARLALWLLAAPGRKALRRLGPAAEAAGATVVCGSDALRERVREAAEAAGAWARTARVALPVDDALGPDATAPDPDLLVCDATGLGGAGLAAVLEAFAAVRAARPTARLYVAGAPGREALGDGVVRLVPAPHREWVRHVRQAFAVFTPQAVVEPAEALGLAEANALGTPVLAHPFGAVREALGEAPGDARQLVDARDPGAAAWRLRHWWDEGRPAVAARPALRTPRVVGDWERVLGVEPPRRGARPTPVAAAA